MDKNHFPNLPQLEGCPVVVDVDKVDMADPLLHKPGLHRAADLPQPPLNGITPKVCPDDDDVVFCFS